MAGMVETGSSAFSKKKAKREYHIDGGWVQEFPGICASSKGNTYA